MDPASTAMGAASLFGLFTICMQCFEYIQYGRRFGEHYESAVLKLAVSQLRLYRWAQSVGLLDNDSCQMMQFECVLSPRDEAIASDLLGNIAEAFENVQKLSKKYEATQRLINPDADADEQSALAVIDKDDEINALSTRFRRMQLAVRGKMEMRQNSNSNLNKTRWALYEKKRFDDLVRDIKDHTDALIDNFPQSTFMQNRLAALEVQEIAVDAKDRRILKSAAEETDSILRDAVDEAITAHDGSYYHNIRLSGNARVFLGNDVAYGAKVKGSTYSNLVIDGNAVVHAGNVYRGRGDRQIEFAQEAHMRRAAKNLAMSRTLIKGW